MIGKKKFFQNNMSFPVPRHLLRNGLSLLSNIFTTRILNAPARRGPTFITWLPTYRCNANCGFCSTHELAKEFPEGLSLDQALGIAHQIGKAKTAVVGFSGGEPFLWPHLFQVIKTLKQYPITIYLVTNGLLLKENTERILESKVDSLVISIDSTDPGEHDAGRQRKGLYQSILEGIEAVKKNRKNGRPILKSTTILSKRSYPHIKETLQNLSKIVDVASFQPISNGYAHGPHNVSEVSKGRYFCDSSEERELREKIDELIDRFPEFNNSYYRNMPVFVFHPEKLLRIKCWSPFLRLQIMPGGTVVHCPVNPRYGIIGDLKKASLMEVWNSKIMVRHREEIRRHKNNCICWTQDASFNATIDEIPFLNSLPVFRKRDLSKL